MKALSLFAFLYSVSVFAAPPDSLYLFKPAPGTHSINFRPELLDSSKSEVKQNGVKQFDLELTNNFYGLDYMYTLNDTATLGARTAFGSAKVKTNTTESKFSGMSDLFFTYGGKSAMTSGTLHWGADLGISPSKGKEASTTVDGNLYSGGMSLTPSVAWVGKTAALDWGVKGSYFFPMERKKESTTAGQENTYTGGTALTVSPFVEVPFAAGRAGAYLRYTSTGELKQKAGSAAEASYQGAYTTLGLGGNVAYSFTETFTGLADFEWFNNSDYQASASYDKGTLTGMNLTIGARATF